MKKAFIYVGHSDWGKSYALKIITNGSSRLKHTNVSGNHVFVRKMSNDDNSGKLLEFVKSIPSKWQEYFILAYCPKQNQSVNHLALESKQILEELRKSCELYFFVQEEKFDNPSMKVTNEEKEYLYQIGTVRVLSGQNIDKVRADLFLNFIKENI